MIFDFLIRKKKCAVCQKETDEILLLDEEKEIFFCRDHLIEEFKKGFLNSPYKIVLFYPELEKVCPYLYFYYPLFDLRKYNFSKKDEKNIEELLEKITGKCRNCENEAQVLYFPTGVLSYPFYGFEYPKEREYFFGASFEKGELLCLDHALAKIQLVLYSNKKNFVEGLAVPFKGNGVYVSTYL